mmetsp:Transcript_25196/g.30451  ORF Transcript_25196/g.30451 Transcript_25196/m.30451 type:complete len:99 (+) Transcript_25196:3-299(+)
MELFFLDKQVREITQKQVGNVTARSSTISSRDELREKLRQRLSKSIEEQQLKISAPPSKEREYGRVDRMLLASKAIFDRMMNSFTQEGISYGAFPDME